MKTFDMYNVHSLIAVIQIAISNYKQTAATDTWYKTLIKSHWPTFIKLNVFVHTEVS